MGQRTVHTLTHRLRTAIERYGLLPSDGAALLMVSGGSDSTALAYGAADGLQEGWIGALAMLHVNHCLRGAASDEDEVFVAQLASLLDIPLFSCRINVSAVAAHSGENWEAAARHERYAAAQEALESLCFHEGIPLEKGRIFTAHTADDRIENFYMRSIVGTGPGGFRSMRYRNGNLCRPLLDCTRAELRDFIQRRVAEGLPTAVDGEGHLWREDATNDETDRFRAFVRHELIPVARKWNPSLTPVLIRTMNLIADEDDMLEAMADELIQNAVKPLDCSAASEASVSCQVPGGAEPGESSEDSSSCTNGFLLLPPFGSAPVPLQRRSTHRLLKPLLGEETRIDTATIQGVLDGFAKGRPVSGYVTNVQGNLAVSANKAGVRVEPMAAFRQRRKKDPAGRSQTAGIISTESGSSVISDQSSTQERSS